MADRWQNVRAAVTAQAVLVVMSGFTASCVVCLVGCKEPVATKRKEIELVKTPRLSRVRSSQPRRKRSPLSLRVVMTDKGFYLTSRHGAECPEGVDLDTKVCIPAPGGEYTAAVLKKLHHHLWYLYASKYKDPSSYANPKEKHSITLMPEPTIKYFDIVRTILLIRDIPADATIPRRPHSLPKEGCTMEFDSTRKTWDFARVNGESVRDTACMYYRVTLTLDPA